MEISRFPDERLLRKLGSTTTRGWLVVVTTLTILPSVLRKTSSAPNLSYAAQCLTNAFPINDSIAASRPLAHELGAA